MSALKDFFGFIPVIHLSHRKDRRAECEAELELHGFPPDTVSWWPAHHNPDHGHAGCTRSHRELLRFIAGSEHERALVLEDDFAFITVDRLFDGGWTSGSRVREIFSRVPLELTPDERFAELVKFVPAKWDVLYLGASYGEPPIGRVNERVIRCGFMQTTSSYGITREFAREWTRRVDADSKGDLAYHPGPIDEVFGSMAKDCLFLVLQPRLMFQRESLSDLDGGTNSRLAQMTDPAHEIMV